MMTDKTSSCLSLFILMKGAFRMFFKFVLLGLCLIIVLFILALLIPKIKLKYRLHKELKEKKKRQEAFKKKMKELEIK